MSLALLREAPLPRSQAEKCLWPVELGLITAGLASTVQLQDLLLFAGPKQDQKLGPRIEKNSFKSQRFRMLAPKRLRQEDYEFEADLGYMETLFRINKPKSNPPQFFQDNNRKH